tara:strand:- start:4202 stop:4915 length:714 start_codon:yes stop_codon:yes gene_type:complete
VSNPAFVVQWSAQCARVRASLGTAMCRPIERMWQSVDVKFKTFARREAPSVAVAASSSSSSGVKDPLRPEPESGLRFDPLRDRALDEALEIERSSAACSSASAGAQPGPECGAQGRKGKMAKTTRATKASKSTKATKESKANSVAANREFAKRVQAECIDATKPIKLVHGLSILGRGDVLTKREWKIPAGVAQHAEGTHGIDRLMAAQLERSLQYAKHANRPRIICESVEQYRLEAR